MIVSRTPLRISFVGGGSDLAAYYKHSPGMVISTTIDKYIYIFINKKFDNKIRASHTVTELADCVDAVQHELIREALKVVGSEGGIEIASISDIPSQGTGLGSSSSFTVGLLNLLYVYAGRHVSAERLAAEASEIEIHRCGQPIGKQDQYIAAYGGLNCIEFNPNETVSVNPIECRLETRRRLQDGLLMLYTGITRSTKDILEEQSANTRKDASMRRSLDKMVQLARDTAEALRCDDLSSFGELMHQGWLEKRKLASGISSKAIDGWYETARRHGGIGGKLLGAGGGGFLLIYAPPERHKEICRALPELRNVPFRFEPDGSKIIYVERNREMQTYLQRD